MDGEDTRQLERLKKSKLKAGDNLKEVSKICNCIGEIYAKYGLWNEAIEEHETELGLCEALEDQIGVAVACRKIGESYAALEEFDKALSYQERHLSIAKTCGDVVEEQRAWATIGKTWLDRVEISKQKQTSEKALVKAEEAFLKSLEACERLKGKTAINNTEYHEMKARLLLNLGLVFDLRGDVAQAEQNMMRALTLAEKFHLIEDMYRCQFSLASLFKRTGAFSRALTYQNLCSKSAQKKLDKHLEGESLLQKAIILIQMKEVSFGKHCLKKAYKIGFRTTEEKDRVKKYFHAASAIEELSEDLTNDSNNVSKKMRLCEKMGDLQAEDKNFKQAIDSYSKMLRYAEKLQLPNKELIPIYFSLAQTYADNKQYQEALSYHRKELTLQDEPQASKTWMNIAEVQQLDCQSYSEVTQSCFNAFDCARNTKDPKLQVLKMLLDVQEYYKKVSHKEKTEEKIQHLKEKYELPSDESDTGETQQSEDGDGSLSELTESEDSDEEVNTVHSTQSHIRRGRVLKTKRNEKGETALHRACIEGNFKKAERLIAQGHPINPRDHSGWLPIHEAANHDHLEIVKLLLSHGAQVNDRGGEHCGGITPLLDAANCGNLEIMELLLSKGGNPLAKDEEGNSVLDCLQQWKSRCGGRLDAEILSRYSKVEQFLQNKVAAHVSRHVSKVTRSDEFVSSQILPSIPHLSKGKKKFKNSEESLRRTIDESDSEPDEIIHRKNNRSKNRSSDYLSRTKNAPEVFPSQNLQNDNHHSATQEYITALTGIGSSAKRATLTKHTPSRPEKESVNDPLITEDDYVGDDWLIDDLQPCKKRRMDVDGFFSTNRNRKPTEPSISAEPKRKRSASKIDPPVNDENSNSSSTSSSLDTNISVHEETTDFSENITEYKSDDETIIITHTSEVERSNILDRNRKTLNQLSRKKKDRQLRITSFSSNIQQKKAGSSSNTVLESGVNSVILDSLSTTFQSVQASENLPQTTSLATELSVAMLKVKVKVKDKLLLVPVSKSDTTNTLSWLAQQVSQRYFSLYGLRPLLTLRTVEGAILSPDDVINMILSSNDEVEAEVHGWDLPPLEERYTQACKVMNTISYRNIKTLLHGCDTSGILKLSHLSLRTSQLQPVFRALQCQNNLKELHLEGNKLGDSGVDTFTKSLESLPNLSILNLSCNDITNVGLRGFADVLKKQCPNSLSGEVSKPLQNLKILNLGYNCFGDSCMLSVVDIIKNTPALSELALRSCQLSAKFFQEHRITMAEVLKSAKIQTIDISYNSLGSLGTELFLKTINHLTVTSLDLSATQTTPGISHLCLNLQNFLQKDGCRLRELNLSKCYIVKDDLDFISSIPTAGQYLQKLTMSQNPKLNNGVLERIIKNSASDRCSLEILTATNCALSSPLSTDFLDSLSDKLNSSFPLREFLFTCDKIDKVDSDSLSQIWTDKWGTIGKYQFSGNMVKLFVQESIQ